MISNVLFLWPLLWMMAMPTEVTVRRGESLPQVARRTLGDERAAQELRALNALSSDKVEEGRTLKLPGPDRRLALSALSAARNAVRQSGVSAPKAKEASQKLKEAETLFSSARYSEAAHAADAAWKHVSETAQKPARFSVEVAQTGKTQVKSQSGPPVRVDAQGVSESVYAGQEVTVEKGHAPRRGGLPAPPSLISPASKAQLKAKVSEGGLGPVLFTWSTIDGAEGYELELRPLHAPQRKPLVLKTNRPERHLGSLSEGEYEWSVRSVRDELRSEPSVARTFELHPEALKLEVHESGWK